MAGGTPERAALSVAVSASLFNQLKGKPCRVFSSDLRIRVVATGLVTYPDVTVICNELETDPDSKTTALNPKVVIEITSDSTEDYDRGEKFDHYRRIESLEEIVFVSHRRRNIEIHRRNKHGWTLQAGETGQTLSLPSIACQLVVDDIYDEISI